MDYTKNDIGKRPPEGSTVDDVVKAFDNHSADIDRPFLKANVVVCTNIYFLPFLEFPSYLRYKQVYQHIGQKFVNFKYFKHSD